MTLASALLSGCCTKPAHLPLAHWQGIDLQATKLVADGQNIPLSPTTPITMKLEPDGKVSGRATVNRYFGTFSTLHDDSILWQGAMGSTRMAGPEDAMKVEAEFFKALIATTQIHSGDKSLTFRSADGRNLVEWARP